MTDPRIEVAKMQIIAGAIQAHQIRRDFIDPLQSYVPYEVAMAAINAISAPPSRDQELTSPYGDSNPPV